MYIPAHFKETDPERIAALIEAYPFGMLITAPAGVPVVSHLPFLFARSADSPGKLLGHMARANPQWQHFAAGSEVLIVFHGPHAYVSPAWYASPGVPTWNYAVVHLRGKPHLMENESDLKTLLERLTHAHESHLPNPWEPQLTGSQQEKLLDMIVGFEIDITDIQGKFKLSQNRSLEDRQLVMQKLSNSDNQTESAVAKLMSGSTYAKF